MFQCCAVICFFILEHRWHILWNFIELQEVEKLTEENRELKKDIKKMLKRMEKQKDTGKVATEGKMLMTNNKVSTSFDTLQNWAEIWLHWSPLVVNKIFPQMTQMICKTIGPLGTSLYFYKALNSQNSEWSDFQKVVIICIWSK